MRLDHKKIGMVLGPMLFLLVLIIQPLKIDPAATDSVIKPGSNEVLATACWVITWWIFEAAPLAVTALLPIVMFTLLGVSKLDSVLSRMPTK